MTSIYNRHYFFEQASYNLTISHELKRPFSIMLLDFDHFKKINDIHGHHIGDLSLRETVEQIKRHCRSQDCFARIGGVEFVIALADTTLQEAKAIAERIQVSIEKNAIQTPQNTSINCHVSIGISSKLSEDDHLKDLMNQAGKALYCAKEQGGNKVVLASH